MADLQMAFRQLTDDRLSEKAGPSSYFEIGQNGPLFRLSQYDKLSNTPAAAGQDIAIPNHLTFKTPRSLLTFCS